MGGGDEGLGGVGEEVRRRAGEVDGGKGKKTR